MAADEKAPAPVRARLQSFHELMPRRIQRILLVSSLYDSFIMSEEGHLHESLLGHFIDLNLTQTPDLVQVSSCAEARDVLTGGESFDLVVSSLNTSDADAGRLARSLREQGVRTPVIALAYTSQELRDFLAHRDPTGLERIFLWQGDVRIFLAMVMYMEDRLNVENDTRIRGVPAIIVVEDSIRFYSSFIPTIYWELFRHTHRLLSEDLNLSQKMMRMRARPKVLLSSSYEEAWRDFERYEGEVLGVISDFEFPVQGKLDKRAGLELCSRVLEARNDVRIVLQSSDVANRKLAEELGASFLLKGSPVLLHQLRTILVERFGFGDFIFRRPDRSEIDRAEDLRSLAEKLRTVPGESIGYHAERNHFSNWLKARTEFDLAEKLRPRKVSEFDGVEHLRQHLLEQIQLSRAERHRTIIADFNRERFEPTVSITRVGGGALGGKARGVAFTNRILRMSDVDRQFPEVDIFAPPAAVIGTQIFDEFLEWDELAEFAMGPNPDEKITEQFVDAPVPRGAAADLRAFLTRVRYPLAVRSSSLLEDSLSQPFAGVYQTHMLPNNDPELDVRWTQLMNAIKRVYASAFLQQAKGYLSMTSYRLEEEKMAVMIQQLVGNQHGDLFYPDFAGVARSHNFYPAPGHQPEDGVVAVALGLGRTVVGGDACLRFCPKYPRELTGFSSVADALSNSQREFYALDLTRETRQQGLLGVTRHSIEEAEEDGPLAWLGSTYIVDDNVVVDGISRDGMRLVSFAQVLKHDAFPLAQILSSLLEQCRQGTGGPVEIEFAGNLGRPGQRPQLAFLQLRPLAMSKESDEVVIETLPDDALVCRSDRVLGNGNVTDVRDVIVVHTDSFERTMSIEIAQQVARLDDALRKEGRPYLLIGVGRWGSTDPNLGIPVGWNQIAGARAIVEAGFKDVRVEPSQGTHFFQNLTSGNVGYFTVNPDAEEGYLDWNGLASCPAAEETEHVRHLRFESPVVIKMSGRSSQGVILKPKL